MILNLLTNWKLAVIAILLAALACTGAYIKLVDSEKSTLAAEKATLVTQLTESQANLKQLQNDIQTQNSAIDKLKSDADARQVAHATEVKKAQDTAKTYKQQSDDLLKRQSAANVPKCDAANSLINEVLKNANK